MLKLAVSSLAVTSVVSAKSNLANRAAASVSRPHVERSSDGHCGTSTPSPEKVAQQMKKFEAKKNMLKKKGMLKASEAADPIVIDTYFHMITSSSGEGTLSDTSVQAQMDELNFGFKDSRFQFNLVEKNVVANDAWFGGLDSHTEAESNMKDTLRKGNATTLNFYTSALEGGTLGWATFPFDYEDEPWMDGVVNDYRTVPGAPDVYASSDEGDTGVHEVGHWLGLFHTFQGGCHDPTDTSAGDGVSDTPQVKEPNFGCTAIDSCPSDGLGSDKIDNFMDYTDDSCMDKFTDGQIARAESFFDILRVNADEGGGEDPCLSLSDLVFANRRAPNRWVGPNTTTCDPPDRYNRARFNSIAVSSSDGHLNGKIGFNQNKGRIWRGDAYLYVIISPSADPEDEDAYFWAQPLFEETDYVVYLSEQPTEERVPPQQHHLGFSFPFGDMEDVDGNAVTIPANDHSHLFVAFDVHQHGDEDADFIADCVTMSSVRLNGPEEEEE